ncbi:sterol desaturase family protein [Ulvibacter litoralis]|uniref:Sterol desaturase/sphingolipid hydroxylase, fatty acid hydroxylase superfamily n=1 Tax=Ulvibacter litoralis TaxID=227084 RepID=A0A1G7DB03_9FLAO|nr:sterol desaturase family protein [Ulvibacter litoralis]SDE48689.1 Sterol desaturase/sphingolipid hydroxylase, fatty acid hydroxylase superfamily [Ulvibacter litoralis]
MDSFLAFFEEMPIWMKAGWVFVSLAFFWILEGYYKLVITPYNKWKHAKTNFGLLFFVMLINALFGIATVGIFVWLETTKFGLLHLVTVPTWLGLLLSILVLDFIAQFGVHYLLHKVKWMWRLHIVHHSDKNVDASTGTRHHPFDFLIRESFALLAVVVMGMPISYYFFYRILSVLFTYFTHANLQLPPKLDKALSYIIVTPVMHKFHHHYQLPWTDSNYGNMFSIWDHLFGTFVYDYVHKIQYGLDISDHLDADNFTQQLRIPFSKKVTSKES